MVRITLKKAQGDGFGFHDSAQGVYQYGHTITNNLDVNYRTGGLDITASLWAGRYGHSKSRQENVLTYYAGPDRIDGVSSKENYKNVWRGWSPQLQVNYMLDENHSFGAFYKYDSHPSGGYSSLFYTDYRQLREQHLQGAFRERHQSGRQVHEAHLQCLLQRQGRPAEHRPQHRRTFRRHPVAGQHPRSDHRGRRKPCQPLHPEQHREQQQFLGHETHLRLSRHERQLLARR